jgi:hypothetical protein
MIAGPITSGERLALCPDRCMYQEESDLNPEEFNLSVASVNLALPG